MGLLQGLSSPADVRGLDREQVVTLAQTAARSARRLRLVPRQSPVLA